MMKLTNKILRFCYDLFIFLLGIFLSALTSYYSELYKKKPEENLLIYMPLATLIFTYLLDKLVTWLFNLK